MTRTVLLMTSALSALSVGAFSARAADAGASASAASDTTIGELVVTAEKRAQNLQTVPVAISAYTAARRQLMGIDTIQDMSNFTPGLEYNSSADRVSLRGVGRQTNVLSADASVANYSDGVYETFAVGAGASTLFVERVEVLRGPQGTLYGRNSIGGTINIMSRRPTTSPYAEIRGTYANYDHFNIEAAVSGPITENIQGRLAGNFEKQSQGWVKNLYPGAADERGVIKEFYLEGQLQWKITDKLDFWGKLGFAQRANGAGGPGDNAGGWTPYPYATTEYANAATQLTPGYGCSGAPGVTNVVNLSPTGCVNPAITSPWLESRAVTYKVDQPYAYTITGHLTYHLPFADLKYVTGGVNYNYKLRGPSGGGDGQGYNAPVTAYTINGAYGPVTIHPQEDSFYQELNAFWSHELNVISTTPGPLQWVAGAYYYRQHYRQPVYTESFLQPQWNGPFPAVCNQTNVTPSTPGGVCAGQTDFRRFDSRPAVTNESYAVFGQLDYRLNESWKFTGGLRYSHDQKYGSESVRLLCFGPAGCYGAVPGTNTGYGVSPNGLGPYTPALDLTQVPTVVDQGKPQGVTAPAVFDPKTGFATRYYNANWQAVTGTAGAEWTPDSQTMVYAKYSRGYKSGGYNIGIYTVLSYFPYTDAEHVDSFELGFKKTWSHTLTTDVAAFWYNYSNLQIPILVSANAGGLTQSATAFYNVPSAISRGIELETTWQATRDLAFLFDYSYLDAYSTAGAVVDAVDPDASGPGARPLPNTAATPWTNDVYTGSLTNCPTLTTNTVGCQKFQSLAGNRLPNAPRNKIAFNANYTLRFTAGSLNISGSYIWRDTQQGALFTRSYNTAPAWDQVDARLTWKAADGRYKIIVFGKNLFNTIGYDAGAVGHRYAGNNVTLVGGNTVLTPVIESPGIGSTYSVTPPRTYGVEIDYTFF